jgi:hypothetical protein
MRLSKKGSDLKAQFPGVPAAFVGEISTIYEAFVRLAAEHGDEKTYAVELLKLLPKPVKEARVWFDKLTSVWRYEYGLPFDRLPEKTLLVGTNVHLPAQHLYVAVRIADRKLRREQFLAFLERLTDRAKHADALFEMRPVRDIDANLQANYEVSGLGLGNTTCDWQIKGRTINIVFDVKKRTKPLIEHMKQMIPDLNRGSAGFLPTGPNPEDLFRSVETKLKERSDLRELQGVWIHSDIKEDEEKLPAYFKNTLNKRKVHFAILSDWEDDAFILARNGGITDELKRIFRLTESKRFVSAEYT